MIDNVRLIYSDDGALTTVDFAGYQYTKRYPTMRAAAAEASNAGLISESHRALLAVRVTGSNGLSNYANEVDVLDLTNLGFSATRIAQSARSQAR